MASTSGNTLMVSQATYGDEEEEAKRRREQLERRPSYKKILQDISTVEERDVKVPKLEQSVTPPATSSYGHLNLPPPQPLQLMVPAIPANHCAVNLQTASCSLSHQHSPARISAHTNTNMHHVMHQFSPLAALQSPYTDTSLVSPSQQLISPMNTDIRGLLPANDTSAPPSMHSYNSQSSDTPSPVPSAGKDGAPPTAKRQQRLEKNREAAKECRRKKKEYVRCLENRVNMLEQQNKTLILQLKSLKDLYCQKKPAT